MTDSKTPHSMELNLHEFEAIVLQPRLNTAISRQLMVADAFQH